MANAHHFLFFFFNCPFTQPSHFIIFNTCPSARLGKTCCTCGFRWVVVVSGRLARLCISGTTGRVALPHTNISRISRGRCEKETKMEWKEWSGSQDQLRRAELVKCCGGCFCPAHLGAPYERCLTATACLSFNADRVRLPQRVVS